LSKVEAQPPRIPVLLVTGFLGSGKTTLVNRLLKTQAFARAAVVINEYGKVSIDHVLVAAPRYRMRVIDNSCLCGHVHEEVASSLLDLHNKRRRNPDLDFDFVLIEMSGLADPVPVMQILLTDKLVTELFELRTVISVADGIHGAEHLAQHPESIKQSAVADTIVISKSDVADAAEIEKLGARLAAINPGARQFRVVHGEIAAEQILDQAGFDIAGRSDAARGWLNDQSYAATTAPASANPDISTFALTYDQEITLPGFVLWLNLLAGCRGAGLLRVKGIVNVEGKPYAVQAVQTVISEPVPLDAWPDEDRRSRLVFITRGMDAATIERTFSTFSFDAGRGPRNMIINPVTYARFRETIEMFRANPQPPQISDKLTKNLELR
jgi:G3E family GTPase